MIFCLSLLTSQNYPERDRKYMDKRGKGMNNPGMTDFDDHK